MKIVTTLLILFFSVFFSVSATSPVVSEIENDKIKFEWQEGKQLTWADFQGEPQLSASFVASTNSGISFSFSYIEKNGHRELDYTVKSNFYPKLSWYKPKFVSNYILKHEQAHFDISELYARILRKKLSQAEFSKNLKQEIEAIYQNNEQERRDMQNKFDAETDHSKVEESEYEWRTYISKQLELYERWK